MRGLLRKIVPPQFRPIGYLNRLAERRTDCRVMSGPFSGMRYVNQAVGGAYIPKLLGIYERELIPVIEKICSLQPELVVNIGAGEGYYAVGLAMRIPGSTVVAFESEPSGRTAIGDMASMNGVLDRIKIRGECRTPDFDSVLGSSRNTIIVCDAEGAEAELLDPGKVSGLARTPVLAEMHDFVCPGVTELIKKRFGPTHEVREIWQESRSRDDFPWKTVWTRLLPGSYLDWAVSEWRPVRMNWLWLTPAR